MPFTWSDDAWNDYVWWQSQDRKTLKRINLLLKDDTKGWESLSRWSLKDPDGGRDESIKKTVWFTGFWTMVSSTLPPASRTTTIERKPRRNDLDPETWTTK